MIKSNPLPIIMGQIPISSEYRIVYETALAHNKSLMLGVSYLGPNVFLLSLLYEPDEVKNIIITGVRGQIAHKFYLIEEGYSTNNRYPQGYYLAPHVSYSNVKFTYKFANTYNYNIRFKYFNLSMLMGYQFVYREYLVIDAFFGLGFRYNIIEANAANQSNIYNADLFPWDDDSILRYLKPTLGFNFGYVFQ